MLEALNTLGKPVIGRVNGAAYGGGVGLMAVCDSVVAAEGARFGLTETRLGLIPATISPYVLARIGEGRARGGVLLGAGLRLRPRRWRSGSSTRVVAAEALDAAVEAEVAPYLAAAPAAVAAAKRLARIARAADRRGGDRGDDRAARRHLGDAGGARGGRGLPGEAPGVLGAVSGARVCPACGDDDGFHATIATVQVDIATGRRRPLRTASRMPPRSRPMSRSMASLRPERRRTAARSAAGRR